MQICIKMFMNLAKNIEKLFDIFVYFIYLAALTALTHLSMGLKHCSEEELEDLKAQLTSMAFNVTFSLLACWQTWLHGSRTGIQVHYADPQNVCSLNEQSFWKLNMKFWEPYDYIWQPYHEMLTIILHFESHKAL